MEYNLTVWGYMDEDVEVLDFQVHKPTDKNRQINSMIKTSGYFLSRVVPYIIKNKDKKFRCDNISLPEQLLLYYLGLHKITNTLDYSSNRLINNNIRSTVEKLISSHPALVNTLWMFDHKGLSPKEESTSIPLTTINSYSRPEVLEFDKKVYDNFKPQNKQVAIIPCTQGKPYHKRRYKAETTFTKISGNGKGLLHQFINDESYDKIVLTSLGLIPKEYWLDEVVMNYDTGTRDLWKLLCLTKQFFLKNQYEKYVVFVKFKPYRDIIRNLIDMGVIQKDQVEFVGEDEKANGLRIMYYPNNYKLY